MSRMSSCCREQPGTSNATAVTMIASVFAMRLLQDKSDVEYGISAALVLDKCHGR